MVRVLGKNAWAWYGWVGFGQGQGWCRGALVWGKGGWLVKVRFGIGLGYGWCRGSLVRG